MFFFFADIVPWTNFTNIHAIQVFDEFSNSTAYSEEYGFDNNNIYNVFNKEKEIKIHSSSPAVYPALHTTTNIINNYTTSTNFSVPKYYLGKFYVLFILFYSRILNYITKYGCLIIVFIF